MMKLVDALPELVSDMETALLHLGRGDFVDQLKEVILERWTYDEFADVTYLYLRAPTALAGKVIDVMHTDRLSLYDEVGVNLDADGGQLCGIEVLYGKRITGQLKNAAGASDR